MYFELYFKRMLTSFCIFFLFIKTHIINLVYIVLINFNINVFMCFSFSTYFIVLLWDDLIYCMINNSIFLFLTVKFIFSCGVITAVLSRLDFIILRTKFSQDLAFI